ncbi:hypothetical protein Cgig2_031973 [Carnegiea gigantea]|uniref:Bms1-type G domain-containing protein n=1 Tax=Carnegiea gigantea TaxID=171969 RepID=A0A9Q1K6B7_9CARY|nr:hypothetical protein Cgig2_031973 [Carnegiea gigantea]
MGGRAQVNKPHKTRFASKSSRNVHKSSLKGFAIPKRFILAVCTICDLCPNFRVFVLVFDRSDRHQIAHSGRNLGKGARASRIQRSKMVRDQKRAAALNAKRAQSVSTSPPRVIVLFGLSANVDLGSLQRDLLALLSSQNSDELFPTAVSSEYKMRATVLKAPYGDLSSCVEMAKVADLIAFVASANSLREDGLSDYIDQFGAQCLSVFRAIGLPSTVVFIRDLPSDLKRRHESKKFCVSSLSSEFPESCKFFPADTKEELHKFLWLLKEQTLTFPHWRNERAHLAAQKTLIVEALALKNIDTGQEFGGNSAKGLKGRLFYLYRRLGLVLGHVWTNCYNLMYVEMVDHDSSLGKCTLLLTGYVRARNLSVNQLVIRTIMPDGSKQEPLLVENIPDPLAGEQTWPTEAEMAEAEEDQKQKKLKRRKLPAGTSEYQAAWILDDSYEDDFGSCDEENNGMVLDGGENGIPSDEAFNKYDFDEDQGSLDLGDSNIETETDSVMVDGENMTREQIEDDIKRLKDAHAEDEEFPDEVDTPLDVPARKRFAKYRGLKSFRTSSWDPKESLPQEYARIFAFDNFARTKKHVLAKALELDKESNDDTVASGTYSRLYIKDVPSTVASKVCLRANIMPIIACGLLQHESKMSVLHFSIKKHDSYTEPIKAKDELIFHVGFRQFVARPIFSTDNINSDKHKMERFLHPGRFSVASIYAPISFPPLPLIAMKNVGDASPAVVAAVGSLKSVDPDRIILKKIILTGYPQRVSKVKATVRYMFHQPEDVRWFKPVEVWTKCGRRGRIKEPVGTHGAMKCLFNGVLQQHDTVCMSLYKRAYPKWPEHKFPLC